MITYKTIAMVFLGNGQIPYIYMKLRKLNNQAEHFEHFMYKIRRRGPLLDSEKKAIMKLNKLG